MVAITLSEFGKRLLSQACGFQWKYLAVFAAEAESAVQGRGTLLVQVRTSRVKFSSACFDMLTVSRTLIPKSQSYLRWRW